MFKLEKSSPPPTRPADERRTDRIEWVDTARGIGILLVILGHAAGGVVDSPGGGRAALPHLIYLLIYSFHMPLFFCLTGLFVASRVKADAKGFMIGSSLRLSRAYATWSVIQFTVIYLMGSALNHPDTGPYLPQLVQLLWQPVSQFWFLYVLVFMQLAACLCVPRLGTAAFLLITAVVTMAAHLYFALHLPNPYLTPVMCQFCTYFVWFGLGTALGPWLPHLAKMRIRSLHAAVACIAWMLFFAVAYVVESHYGALLTLGSGRLYPTANDPVFVPAALSGVAMVTLASAAPIVPFRAFVDYLGRQSMAIFLTHVLFIAGTRIVVARLLPGIEPTVLLACAATAGLSGSLLFLHAAKQLRITKALALT